MTGRNIPSIEVFKSVFDNSHAAISIFSGCIVGSLFFQRGEISA